ncbi:MAG: PAS domain S-box protein [Bacteroidetes bacterium]|nr:PAS domain S-box protein [Bacteroidota bacterium]MBL6943075.1 PAS domain S-box protein [Bacteroidales bacterium]
MNKPHKDPLNIRKYAMYSAILWTLLIAASLLWNIKLLNREALNRAYIYTKVGFEKDLILRRWISEHGSVYVKIDSATQPNPYLSDIPYRDISIDSDLNLTLINPAYLTRQIHEIQEQFTEVRGHITSLNPIRPENAPDSWEVIALESFENGEPEYYGIDTLNGMKYYRYMQPLLTEHSCLACHAKQGYKLNEIRGGISISYPLDRIYQLSNINLHNHFLLHFVIWLFGLGVVAFAYWRIKKSDNKRIDAEDSLLNLNKELERKVELRSLELQKSSYNWENIFNTLETPAQLIDKNHIIKYVNESTLKIFKTQREELIGKKCHTIFHLSDSPPMDCPLVSALNSNQPFSNEMLIEAQGTTYIVSCSPIYDTEGNIEHFIHIMTDISERKEMEIILKESQQRFETLFNSSTDAMFVHPYSESGFNNFIEVNHYACEMLGYSREELLNVTAIDISSKPDAEFEAAEANRRKLSREKRSVFEAKMIKKNGDVFPVEIISIIFNYQNQQAIMSVVRDISERKKIDEEVKQLNKDLDRRIKELSFLLEVSQTLIRTQELEKILQTITDFSTQLISLDSAAIYLVQGEKLYLGAATPQISSDFPEEFRYATLVDHPHILKCILTAEPHTIPDLEKAELTAAEKEILKVRSFKTLLYIPLMIESRAVGVLILGTFETIREFTKHEIDLFITLSVQSALTIENALLYKESITHSEKLETNIKQLTKAEKEIVILNADLEKKIKVRTQQIEEKNKELERINKLFVGRELRMAELKKEIDELKKGNS